jgi:hypothetical protein
MSTPDQVRGRLSLENAFGGDFPLDQALVNEPKTNNGVK